MCMDRSYVSGFLTVWRACAPNFSIAQGQLYVTPAMENIVSFHGCLVTQSCPTLFDPMHCSLSGSSIHRLFQARILEWVAISFSRGSSQPRD